MDIYTQQRCEPGTTFTGKTSAIQEQFHCHKSLVPLGERKNWVGTVFKEDDNAKINDDDDKDVAVFVVV